MSLMHGGIKITDVRHFPWFAFIKAALPDIMWEVFDPKTKEHDR